MWQLYIKKEVQKGSPSDGLTTARAREEKNMKNYEMMSVTELYKVRVRHSFYWFFLPGNFFAPGNFSLISKIYFREIELARQTHLVLM